MGRRVVDIATEWNLKYLDAGITLVENQVDIATEWNLKLKRLLIFYTVSLVDIATEWNLKQCFSAMNYNAFG